MKVLVVGGGGREHTLAWKIRQSPRVKELYCAPGNAGTAAIAQNLPIESTDIPALVKAAQELGIGLVVIGPEAALDAGIVDTFQKVGIPTFGPTKAATRIESSKAFAKELMVQHGIPCGRGESFQTFAKAIRYLAFQKFPAVIKADGLVAGKGVTVVHSFKEGEEILRRLMIARVLGDAGNQVVIEECLFGKEVSLMAFTDGKTVKLLVPACDYKRLRDDDEGPNTGGMGSYSPSEFLTPALIEQITKTILLPAVGAMANEGRPFKGVLYAGLMITSEGPKVLEFNARFGDPETQVQLPLLETDLVEILLAVIEERLDQIKIEWSNEACVGVVMASEGYPDSPKTGRLITGLEKVEPEILVFHAGTKLNASGQLVTAGGRVLTVVAIGKTMAEAYQKVYQNLPRICFEGCHYRKDIAKLT